jgi:imidazolonepropionase-like amidohydrolase
MNCTPPIFGNRRFPVREASSSSTLDVLRPKLHGIKASLLIPGRGDPINNGAVIIHDDTIAYAGPQSSIPAKFKAVSFVEVQVVMPGMWDCHVHYFGAPTASTPTPDNMLSAYALKGARVAKAFENTLMAGFTSVREVGGFGGEVSVAVCKL